MTRKLVLGLSLMIALVIVLAGAAGAETDDKDKSLRALPGYVDFAALDLISDEAKVEVNLRDPMLKLVGAFMADDEPELHDLLAGLKLVRVRVYNLTPDLEKQLLDAGAKTASRLDKDGWERIVRVRDEGEHVDVYFKPSTKSEWIDGVLVIAVGEDDEAVFVNLVGTIRPDAVARIGEHLEIDGLDKVRIESKIKN